MGRGSSVRGPLTRHSDSRLLSVSSLEFRPGEPWKGYPNIDPETDPYVTPGSVINNLSINTVREVDHLRDRNSGTCQHSLANSHPRIIIHSAEDGLLLSVACLTLMAWGGLQLKGSSWGWVVSGCSVAICGACWRVMRMRSSSACSARSLCVVVLKTGETTWQHCHA